jgi:hypothetical protein
VGLERIIPKYLYCIVCWNEQVAITDEVLEPVTFVLAYPAVFELTCKVSTYVAMYLRSMIVCLNLRVKYQHMLCAPVMCVCVCVCVYSEGFVNKQGNAYFIPICSSH